MRRLFGLLLLLIAAAVIAGCDQAANTNSANRPANTSNASNASAANSAPSAAAIETEIKKQMNDMAAALQKNDAAYFEKLYTDNYMFVSTDGAVATGAQRIASMKSGETKYESISYDDVSVRSNPEGNGAISISVATVKGVNLGKPVDGKFRVSHVWSKTKDGWRLASGQTTPLGAASATSKPASNSNGAAPAANSAANANK
jgi:uncharacterized protein (TIGR02246 family)